MTFKESEKIYKQCVESLKKEEYLNLKHENRNSTIFSIDIFNECCNLEIHYLDQPICWTPVSENIFSIFIEIIVVSGFALRRQIDKYGLICMDGSFNYEYLDRSVLGMIHNTLDFFIKPHLLEKKLLGDKNV